MSLTSKELKALGVALADKRIAASIAAKIGPDFQNLISLGSATSYFSAFLSGSNMFSIYAEDKVATGYTDGVSVILRATAGNGTGAIRPFQSIGRAAVGSDLAELYGASFYAIHDDGGRVRDNAYGVMAYLEIDETGVLDSPTGYVCGAIGVYSTPGVNPLVLFGNPGAKAAVLGVVKGNPNSVPHAAIIAFAEGDHATDPAIPAAFKAIASRSTPGRGFNYGLDLYKEIGTLGYNTADIRGESGDILKNSTVGQWETTAKIKAAGIQTKVGSANLTGAVPTAASLVAAFGAAATTGDGFVGKMMDTSDHTKQYIVLSDGSDYFFAALTKAV